MSVIDTAMRVGHVVFAGLWTGGALFMAAGVVPAARNGRIGEDAIEWIAQRFTYLTVGSVLVLFVTGGHLAGTLYTFESLAGSGRGHLVLTMIALWLVMAVLLHFGTRKLLAGARSGSLDAGVDRSLPWFRASGVGAVLLLVVAGLL